MSQNSFGVRGFAEQAFPHLNELYRTATYVLDYEPDAVSVVLESFSRAYRSWQDHHFCPNVRLWLFKVMINALTNRYLSAPRHSVARDKPDELNTYFMHDKTKRQRSGGDLNQISVSTISETEIRKAIEELPGHIRLIVILSLLDGFSYREIADITGVRLEDVRFRLHQGRKLIRENITNMWQGTTATG